MHYILTYLEKCDSVRTPECRRLFVKTTAPIETVTHLQTIEAALDKDLKSIGRLGASVMILNHYAASDAEVMTMMAGRQPESILTVEI